MKNNNDLRSACNAIVRFLDEQEHHTAAEWEWVAASLGEMAEYAEKTRSLRAKFEARYPGAERGLR